MTDEAIDHPWMHETLPVKRRKTGSRVDIDVQMSDSTKALDSVPRAPARRVATLV